MTRRNAILRQATYLFAWLFFATLLIFGCQNTTTQDSSESNPIAISFADQVSIDHAIGFNVIYHDDWKEVQLFRHYNDAVDTVKYALILAGERKEGFDKSHTIRVPVKSVGALSTTQLGMFGVLNALDNLKAIETKQYVHNKEIASRTEGGQITELAPAGKLNLETTMASGIDLLMGVGYPNAQNKDYQTLQLTGMPVLLNADWQETSLLGRAEWMKLLAVLLNKEKEVNEQFAAIEADYNATLALIENKVSQGPKTITGLANGDSWYVSGGNSFANNLLKVVKVDYPWSETVETGSLRLDFETVYEQGLRADYWLVPSTAKTLAEIIQADARYADFKSFKEQHIYNIYGRYTPGGGNDYYESAIVAPHVVLKDMVKIFHPELLPSHELVYYNKLQ